MNQLKRICVFCGSRAGDDEIYRHAAERLGTVLAEQNIELVFGGGSVGMMGAVADAALAGNVAVHGVIPEILAEREAMHPHVQPMHVVDSMHTRKALMAKLSDAFIAMPGGFGTLEELFEVITWAQLGIHQKPVGLLNVGGFFDGLIHFLNHTIEQGFVNPKYRQLMVVDHEPHALLDRLRSYRPLHLPPIISEEQT